VHRKPRILCVDDRVENARIRVMLLNQFGCETLLTEDHQSAMRVLTENDIDLLLIDYHLANGRTGDEIARDARVIRPGTPIIMLTGDTRVPEIVYGCVDEVLLKGSSDPRTLLDTIQRLLPHARLKPRGPMIVASPPAKHKAS